jgi:hypothetical protein
MEVHDFSDAIENAQEHVLRWRFPKNRLRHSIDDRNSPDEILKRWLSICYGIEISVHHILLRSSEGLVIGHDHSWKVTWVRDSEKATMFKLRF